MPLASSSSAEILAISINRLKMTSVPTGSGVISLNGHLFETS
jgi:hypothetical protein